MREIITYLTALKDSIFNLSYYQKIQNTDPKFSIKFFLVTLFVYAIIIAAVSIIIASPKINNFKQKFQENAAGLFPNNLEVNIQNGKVNTNQQEPYFIPINLKKWVNSDIPDSAITNLVVIDTNSTNPYKDIKEYQTIFFVGKNSIALYTAVDNQPRILNIDKSTDITITKQSYLNLLNNLTPMINFLPIITMLILWVILFLSFSITKLIHITLFSLIALMASSLLKPKLSYKKIFQSKLHAFIVPTLIFSAGKLAIPDIPSYFYSAVFFIFFLTILSKLEKLTKPTPDVNKFR